MLIHWYGCDHSDSRVLTLDTLNKRVSCLTSLQWQCSKARILSVAPNQVKAATSREAWLLDTENMFFYNEAPTSALEELVQLFHPQAFSFVGRHTPFLTKSFTYQVKKKCGHFQVKKEQLNLGFRISFACILNQKDIENSRKGTSNMPFTNLHIISIRECDHLSPLHIS